jgi:hypothetical protein
MEGVLLAAELLGALGVILMFISLFTHDKGQAGDGQWLFIISLALFAAIFVTHKAIGRGAALAFAAIAQVDARTGNHIRGMFKRTG